MHAHSTAAANHGCLHVACMHDAASPGADEDHAPPPSGRSNIRCCIILELQYFLSLLVFTICTRQWQTKHATAGLRRSCAHRLERAGRTHACMRRGRPWQERSRSTHLSACACVPTGCCMSLRAEVGQWRARESLSPETWNWFTTVVESERSAELQPKLRPRQSTV